MLLKLTLLSVLLCLCLETANSREVKCKIMKLTTPTEEFDEHIKAYCYNAFEEDIESFYEKHKLIHELKLTRANIQYIDEYMFLGYSNLTNLTIIDSAIEEIEQNSLLQLENLEVLEISLSELQRLDDFAFGNLSNLNQLILNDNFIREIDPYTFSNLTNLMDLQLRNNELEVIYMDTFVGLTNVEVIDLSGNPIEYIEESAFDSCFSLKKLILDKSSFEHLNDLYLAYDFEVVFVTSEIKSQQRLKMVVSKEIAEFMNLKPNTLSHPLLAMSMVISLIGVIIFLLIATVLISFFLKRYKYINENCSRYTGPVAGDYSRLPSTIKIV